MKIKYYLITAVVTYFLFIIYLAPAAPLLDLLINEDKNVSASSVTGSLWSGDVRSIQVKNHRIIDAHWSFSPLRLLTGEISFDIQALYQNNPISTSVGLSLTGKYILHNLTTTIAAYPTGKILDIPVGELDGNIKIDIDDVSWSAGTVPTITGNILWKQAAYLVAERAELGDLSIVFDESDTSPLVATIKNTPEHLDIDGNITVDKEGHYILTITLKPTNTASKNLRNSLKLFAKPLPDGSFEINNTGELSTLGLM